MFVGLLQKHRILAQADYHANNFWSQCSIFWALVQLDQSFVELSRNAQTKDANTIIHHLVRRLLVHSELIASEIIEVLADVEVHESQAITWATFNKLLKSERLKEIDHVFLLECLHTFSYLAPVIFIEPHATIWVPGLLVSSFLLNLREDALGSLHCLNSLFYFMEKALINEESLA